MKRQIPNMLSILRLLMIPLFVVLYFKYPEGNAVYITAAVYFLAWATDVLDGWLARRNNWITEAGKIIDPLADKLMQITVAVCFTVDNRVFLCLLIPLLVKELGMALGALVIIKQTKAVMPSRWYGKAATVLQFGCAMIRIIVRGNETLDTVLAVTMLAAMLFALAMYYFKDFRGKYNIDLFGKK